MGAWIELHQSTAGWSTLVIVVWIAVIIIVGKRVMLDSAHESWVNHHIILVTLGATLLTLILFAGSVALSQLLFSVMWPGLPLGLALTIAAAALLMSFFQRQSVDK
jgi:hypothetical protein